MQAQLGTNLRVLRSQVEAVWVKILMAKINDNLKHIKLLDTYERLKVIDVTVQADFEHISLGKPVIASMIGMSVWGDWL